MAVVGSTTPLIALDAVVIDSETTSLDPAKARIVEIAAVRLDGWAGRRPPTPSGASFDRTGPFRQRPLRSIISMTAWSQTRPPSTRSGRS